MGRRRPFNRLTLTGKVTRLARSFPADAAALDCLVTAIWLRRLREIRGQRDAHTSSHPGDGTATPPQLQTTGDAPSSATTVAIAEQAGQK